MVTLDVSHKPRPPAMRAIRAGRREAFMMTFLLFAVLAILRFLFHRTGRFYQPEASSLSGQFVIGA
jgi:hypothetical protein